MSLDKVNQAFKWFLEELPDPYFLSMPRFCLMHYHLSFCMNVGFENQNQKKVYSLTLAL